MIILATHNPGKVKEFKTYLEPFGYEIKSLLDFPDLAEVEETGETFEENARLKAEAISQEFDAIVIADDTGLVVPSLGGEPGIYSARYAGEDAKDSDNVKKLLEKLSDKSDRSAYFVTCIVASRPGRASLVVEGRAYGTILEETRGEGGFGYDPVFYVEEEGKTFAQMSPDEKNKISHRGKALAKLEASLAEWLQP